MSRRAHTCLLVTWWLITLVAVAAVSKDLNTGLLAMTCAIYATTIGAHHPVDKKRA